LQRHVLQQLEPAFLPEQKFVLHPFLDLQETSSKTLPERAYSLIETILQNLYTIHYQWKWKNRLTLLLPDITLIRVRQGWSKSASNVSVNFSARRLSTKIYCTMNVHLKLNTCCNDFSQNLKLLLWLDAQFQLFLVILEILVEKLQNHYGRFDFYINSAIEVLINAYL